MDLIEKNREAWNIVSKQECDWSLSVSNDEIRRAQSGEWSVRLTTKKAVPADWFPDLKGINILCLAAGGGQQAPTLAAAGANVTSVDISEEQLAKDASLARQHGLSLDTQRGEMTDLSAFDSESFDLVFNPASNLFIPNVAPLWASCFRVLKRGGLLFSGAMNPSFFLFDHDEAIRSGTLEVKFPLPYSDLDSLTEAQETAMRRHRSTIEFGHTLEDLIGGQIKCGFRLTGFYEDYWDDAATLLNLYSPTSFAIRAEKPGS